MQSRPHRKSCNWRIHACAEAVAVALAHAAPHRRRRCIAGLVQDPAGSPHPGQVCDLVFIIPLQAARRAMAAAPPLPKQPWWAFLYTIRILADRPNRSEWPPHANGSGVGWGRQASAQCQSSASNILHEFYAPGTSNRYHRCPPQLLVAHITGRKQVHPHTPVPYNVGMWKACRTRGTVPQPKSGRSSFPDTFSSCAGGSSGFHYPLKF